MVLSGSLSRPNQLRGTLSAPQSQSGNITDDTNKLVGAISKPDNLSGNLGTGQQLAGSISMPVALSAMISNPEKLTGKLSNATLRGYSAYDLAVLAGYEGTEEEWLESLRGADGRSIEIRNKDGIIEYKYTDGSMWMVLIDFNGYYNDYEKLINKPSLDGTVLIGDRDLSDDYLRNDRALTNLEIDELLQ